MKKSIAFFFAVFAIIFSVVPAYAAQDSVTKTATVKVPSHLSITEDTGNFDLNFSSFVEEGDTTDTKLVTYTIKGNNLPTAALDDMVVASIDATEYGIDLKGDVGTYTNQGSTGNATLNEAAAGFITVGTTPVGMADKPLTTGNQAKVMHGDLQITWRADATKELTFGDYPIDLTVTVKDA